MLFINQREFPHVPYPTNIQEPDSELAVNGNISDAGCGICSACMMVDRLCLEKLSMEECIDMSIKAGANKEPGTDMLFLGPAVAERFDLTMTTSNDTADLIDCLQRGGCCIVNPGGDYEGHYGLFTHGGHYMTIVSYDPETKEFLILDPSYSPTKFKEEKRQGQVREDGCLVYAKADVIEADSANRDPRYCLFFRNADRRK